MIGLVHVLPPCALAGRKLAAAEAAEAALGVEAAGLTTRHGCAGMDAGEYSMPPGPLAASLVSATPQNFAGSRTIARYDFQAHYAILKIVELLEAGNDFRIVFDLYDDLAVLNSASEPTMIGLYQIKTKDPGQWSTAQLCERVGKKKPTTYVGRLYSHVGAFGDALQETGFVSNAAFVVDLGDGSKTNGDNHVIKGSLLHSDEVSKITIAVKGDDPTCDVPSWLPKLMLIRTPLGVHGQELVVLGRLQQFIEAKCAADGVKMRALYETLHGSIHERSRLTAKSAEQSELLARKSLTKTELDDLLLAAMNTRLNFSADWPLIQADLAAAHVGSADQLRLRTECLRYRSLRSAGHGDIIAISQIARQWLAEHKVDVDKATTILGLADVLLHAALADQLTQTQILIRAVSIVEAYEAIHGS